MKNKLVIAIFLLSGMLNAFNSVAVNAENAMTIKKKQVDAQASAIINTDKGKKQKLNEDTANAVNRIPGVHVQSQNLQPPEPLPPIRGFHPIKAALRPVENLTQLAIQLEQQVMKLEGPIAGLQPPMLGLQKRMSSVETKMGTVNKNIGTVNENIGTVRADITGMRGDIASMRKELVALRGPILEIQKPLAGVARPLGEVQSRLQQVQALIATVLLAILIAAGAIAVGTPVAAILVYRNRRKLFPDMRDEELAIKTHDHHDRQPATSGSSR